LNVSTDVNEIADITFYSRLGGVVVSPYLKENTTLHHYKDQLVYTV